MPHGTTLIQPTRAHSYVPTLFRLNAAVFVSRLTRERLRSELSRFSAVGLHHAPTL